MNPTISTSMAITSTDLAGMDVCTHNHTHSSSSTVNYTYSWYTNARHIARCSTCKAFIYQDHTFNSYGCTKCGFSKTYNTSMVDYEDYDLPTYEDISEEVEDAPLDKFNSENAMPYPYDMPFAPAETN